LIPVQAVKEHAAAGRLLKALLSGSVSLLRMPELTEIPLADVWATVSVPGIRLMLYLCIAVQRGAFNTNIAQPLYGVKEGAHSSSRGRMRGPSGITVISALSPIAEKAISRPASTVLTGVIIMSRTTRSSRFETR